jgi:AraC-like DNA-binding protein
MRTLHEKPIALAAWIVNVPGMGWSVLRESAQTLTNGAPAGGPTAVSAVIECLVQSSTFVYICIAAGRGAARRGAPRQMQRLSFSSDALPSDLDHDARRALWHETYAPSHTFDVSYLADRPFKALTDYINFGGVEVIKFQTTIARLTRTSRHVAAEGRHNLSITFHGAARGSLSHGGRESLLAGKAILSDHGEPCDYRAASESSWLGVSVPRGRLLELVGNAEDLVNRPFDPAAPPMRYLRRFLRLVFDPELCPDELVKDHIEQTLLDLIALALNVGGDTAALAQMRGLRAARTQSILAALRGSFRDPACSADTVALRLGLSTRYVQDLLHDTGRSLSERLMEMRLQHARATLADPRCDRLKVIDVAYRCGFNNLSHFNRCFRRRFDATPTEYRAKVRS